MKKVLILSVIAMLALGVMALAGTYTAPTTPGTVTVGATCADNSLVVTSIIGIEQGYVATATSYDASFCGATGNPLLGNFLTTTPASAILAKLSVESNMSSIAVAVITTATGPDSGSVAVTSYFSDYISYSSDYNGTDLSLTGYGVDTTNGVITPYSGTLYVYGPAKIPAWTTAGQYTLKTEFTITPENKF